MGGLVLKVFRVKVEKGRDGFYVAQCMELPAAISQGKTIEEAVRNIREAIELVLEDIEAEVLEKKPKIVNVEV